MPPLFLQKGLNAWRRLRNGLPARGGVSPEVSNDLFQALAAVYAFAAGYVQGQRVLDLGCGTGYGSARLAAAGAASVVGLDADEKSLAYARRRFSGPRFLNGTPEELPDDVGMFERIIAADLLAHLKAPAAAVDRAIRHLAPDGLLLAAVPPILDDRTMERRQAAGSHRSNLYLWDWESLFRKRFKTVRLFRAEPPAGTVLDLASPFPSKLRAEDFLWEEISPAQLGAAGSLSVVIIADKAQSGR
ncbi:MAG TPA: class I SAM-dependent methyltransferase [Thermoanaerobaculia bacterium]|jgi:SAM-dependent methyltransferase|nr:class I SAM-dependent methyltransferase [Thermoanaerobaculia bacterium]